MTHKPSIESLRDLDLLLAAINVYGAEWPVGWTPSSAYGRIRGDLHDLATLRASEAALRHTIHQQTAKIAALEGENERLFNARNSAENEALVWKVWRLLQEGEMTQPGDEMLVDKEWEPIREPFRPAPSPDYTSHVKYRRKIADELTAERARADAMAARVEGLLRGFERQEKTRVALLGEVGALKNRCNGVLQAVYEERTRQDAKWGGQPHDDEHDPRAFIQLIEDYAGWARVMFGMGSPIKGMHRLVQVAALAVATVESVNRRITTLEVK